MRTDKKVYSSEELLKTFDRVSKKIDFFGCGVTEDTEKCIERRLKKALDYRAEQYERTKSEEARNAMKQLENLINHNFAYRWTVEAYYNPHPIYKERLGIPDEEYDRDVKEKKEAQKVTDKILEYERILKQKRLKKG